MSKYEFDSEGNVLHHWLLGEPDTWDVFGNPPSEWLFDPVFKQWYDTEWYPANYPQSRRQARHRYFITFTLAPDKGVTVEEFTNRLRFELARKYVLSFRGCIENRDSNIHAHVMLDTDVHLKKTKQFSTWTKKYGFVDLKKINYDNGIEQYFTGDVFTEISEIN